MRCEICNRSMTETFLDGAGDEHEYCQYCSDEIQDTLESYDEEDDLNGGWWPELYPDDDLNEEEIEEDQALREAYPD